MDHNYVLPLNRIGRSHSELVGSKAAVLGELLRAGFRVPPGFVVTIEAFRQFRSEPDNPILRAAILKAFQQLGAPYVAVRSSAPVEDGEKYSWAGQFLSKTQVGQEGLLSAILECWESVTSARASAYARAANLNPSDLEMAVIIQQMVPSESSGISFSVNPTTSAHEVVIAACIGLGETLADGQITPDRYVVERDPLTLRQVIVNRQLIAAIVSSDGKKTIIDLAPFTSSPKIESPVILEVAKITVQVEAVLERPVDVEWAQAGGQIYVLQARPLTHAGSNHSLPAVPKSGFRMLIG